MIHDHLLSRAAINLIAVELLVLTITFAGARDAPDPPSSRQGDGGSARSTSGTKRFLACPVGSLSRAITRQLMRSLEFTF
jgi:hypothetical protein